MKSHFISQVLLRRFSLNNKIKAHNLATHNSYFIKPADTAYLDVPIELFNFIERKFGQVETKAATAFTKLDNGILLESPKDIESIKQFMVLHFVRSAAFLNLFVDHSGKYFLNFIEDAKRNHPAEADEIDKNIPALKNKWSAELFKKMPISLKDNIKKVEGYVKKFDIEIGVAPEGTQFILGDNPTINVSSEGKVGVLAGVGITNSTGFALPLSPKYLVAAISKNKLKTYRNLTAKEVGNCNAKILSQCLFEYYTQK